MGKTQIALELAYRVQERVPDNGGERWSVFWMPGQSVAAFREGASKVAEALNVVVGKDGDATKVLHEYLESGSAGPWLLILDNLDDGKVLGEPTEPSDGLRSFLPESRNGRILFTTRSSQIAVDVAGGEVVELEAMPLAEAKQCLATALVNKPSPRDDAITTDLVEKLTCLPLTIGQAAAYMNQNRLPVRGYLRLWTSTDQGRIALLSKKLRDQTHHSAAQGAVATTWIISFDAICRASTTAAVLLSFIQWIDCKAIPQSLLPVSTGAEKGGKEEENEVRRADAIGLICAYGFLSWREDGELLDMHPLVHLALRLWPKEGWDGVVLSEAAASALLFDAFPANFDRANVARWTQYLPHVAHLATDVVGRDETLLGL